MQLLCCRRRQAAPPLLEPPAAGHRAPAEARRPPPQVGPLDADEVGVDERAGLWWAVRGGEVLYFPLAGPQWPPWAVHALPAGASLASAAALAVLALEDRGPRAVAVCADLRVVVFSQAAPGGRCELPRPAGAPPGQVPASVAAAAWHPAVGDEGATLVVVTQAGRLFSLFVRGRGGGFECECGGLWPTPAAAPPEPALGVEVVSPPPASGALFAALVPTVEGLRLYAHPRGTAAAELLWTVRLADLVGGGPATGAAPPRLLAARCCGEEELPEELLLLYASGPLSAEESAAGAAPAEEAAAALARLAWPPWGQPPRPDACAPLEIGAVAAVAPGSRPAALLAASGPVAVVALQGPGRAPALSTVCSTPSGLTLADARQLECRRPSTPAGAGGGAAEELRVLETPAEARKLLSGKRVLHVKGFGGGFGDPPEEQRAAQQRQDEAAAQAIERFRPDYLVVDGDPWGSGFQRYVKAYVEGRVGAGLPVPELVWVKNVKGSSPTPEEREKRLGQAREWADQGLSVIVSWLPEAAISQGVDSLFGVGCWEKLQGQKFDFRGAVRLLEAAEPDKPAWLRGLKGTAPGLEMYRAIEAVESRPERQFFEKCSFENAAKGNAIYWHLRGEGHSPAAQGAVSFGGGESVLLEFATLYLFPGSGFDEGQAALFPFSRGRPSDPKLPAHEGHAFTALGAMAAFEECEWLLRLAALPGGCAGRVACLTPRGLLGCPRGAEDLEAPWSGAAVGALLDAARARLAAGDPERASALVARALAGGDAAAGDFLEAVGTRTREMVDAGVDLSGPRWRGVDRDVVVRHHLYDKARDLDQWLALLAGAGAPGSAAAAEAAERVAASVRVRELQDGVRAAPAAAAPAATALAAAAPPGGAAAESAGGFLEEAARLAAAGGPHAAPEGSEYYGRAGSCERLLRRLAELPGSAPPGSAERASRVVYANCVAATFLGGALDRRDQALAQFPDRLPPPEPERDWLLSPQVQEALEALRLESLEALAGGARAPHVLESLSCACQATLRAARAVPGAGPRASVLQHLTRAELLAWASDGGPRALGRGAPRPAEGTPQELDAMVILLAWEPERLVDYMAASGPFRAHALGQALALASELPAVRPPLRSLFFWAARRFEEPVSRVGELLAPYPELRWSLEVQALGHGPPDEAWSRALHWLEPCQDEAARSAGRGDAVGALAAIARAAARAPAAAAREDSEAPRVLEPPQDGGKAPRELETPEEVQELLSGKPDVGGG